MSESYEGSRKEVQANKPSAAQIRRMAWQGDGQGRGAVEVGGGGISGRRHRASLRWRCTFLHWKLAQTDASDDDAPLPMPMRCHKLLLPPCRFPCHSHSRFHIQPYLGYCACISKFIKKFNFTCPAWGMQQIQPRHEQWQQQLHLPQHKQQQQQLMQIQLLKATSRGATKRCSCSINIFRYKCS